MVERRSNVSRPSHFLAELASCHLSPRSPSPTRLSAKHHFAYAAVFLMAWLDRTSSANLLNKQAEKLLCSRWSVQRRGCIEGLAAASGTHFRVPGRSVPYLVRQSALCAAVPRRPRLGRHYPQVATFVTGKRPKQTPVVGKVRGLTVRQCLTLTRKPIHYRTGKWPVPVLGSTTMFAKRHKTTQGMPYRTNTHSSSVPALVQ